MKVVSIIILAFLSLFVHGESVVVNVSELSPFVINKNGNFSGFDVELFDTVAKKMDLQYKIVEVPFGEIIKNVNSGKADIGFSSITINEKREKMVDFSHSYMNSNVRILVNTQSSNRIDDLKDFVFKMFKPIILFFLFVVFFAHVMWFFERGKDAINDNYFPGVMEGAWLTLTTMTTVGYGDIAPKQWAGRVAALFLMLVGISFFGWAVAELSASLTSSTITHNIKNINDLKGKRVATVIDSTSFDLLENSGANVVGEKNLEKAVVDLYSKKVEAVVFDEPSLLYILQERNDGNLVIVGDILKTESFGFAFVEKSELREEFNRNLLKLKGDGVYDEIYKRWFK